MALSVLSVPWVVMAIAVPVVAAVSWSVALVVSRGGLIMRFASVPLPVLSALSVLATLGVVMAMVVSVLAAAGVAMAMVSVSAGVVGIVSAGYTR